MLLAPTQIIVHGSRCRQTVTELVTPRTLLKGMHNFSTLLHNHSVQCLTFNSYLQSFLVPPLDRSTGEASALGGHTGFAFTDPTPNATVSLSDINQYLSQAVAAMLWYGTSTRIASLSRMLASFDSDSGQLGRRQASLKSACEPVVTRRGNHSSADIEVSIKRECRLLSKDQTHTDRKHAFVAEQSTCAHCNVRSKDAFTNSFLALRWTRDILPPSLSLVHSHSQQSANHSEFGQCRNPTGYVAAFSGPSYCGPRCGPGRAQLGRTPQSRPVRNQLRRCGTRGITETKVGTFHMTVLPMYIMLALTGL